MSGQYYKVCSKDIETGITKSTFADVPLALTYSLGEVTKPKLGSLFCFTNLIHAKNWLRKLLLPGSGIEHFSLFQGEGEVSKIQSKCMLVSYFLWKDIHLKLFWEDVVDGRNCSERNRTFPLVKGTIFLDWFKPTVELEIKNLREKLNDISIL